MPLTALQLSLAIASLASYALLVAVLYRKRSYHRWPFLFSLAVFEIVLTTFLLTQNSPDRYAAYSCAYWGGEVIRGFLVLGVIVDVIRRIPGSAYAPSNLIVGFLTLASTMAAGCAWLAHSGGAHTFHMTMMVFALDRCVAVIWGSFAASLFCAIGFCGLGWTKTPLRIASSLLAFIVVSGAGAYAMSAWPHYTRQIDDIANICITAIWISWSVIVYLEQEAEEVFHSDRALSFIKALLPSK